MSAPELFASLGGRRVGTRSPTAMPAEHRKDRLKLIKVVNNPYLEMAIKSDAPQEPPNR